MLRACGVAGVAVGTRRLHGMVGMVRVGGMVGKARMGGPDPMVGMDGMVGMHEVVVACLWRM